jgi:two-component system OmpR family sensor kinase/two-component system sensor histidine kinase BaeS
MSRDPQWWAHGPGGDAWRGFGRRLFVGAVVFLGTLVLGGAVIALALLQVVPERWLAVALAPLVVVALVALTARFWMRTWRPVRHLIDAAGSLADGDYSRRVESTASPTMRPVVASFNKMAERLERADEQRRQLLADVGHELRTPLTVVRGEIEAMIDGVHPPDAERLELLLEEVAVMERLLTDLRTLSLAEAGALALHREPTDVAALVGDVADGYRRMAAEAGVAVAVDVHEAVGEVVLDPVRIREVLSNLVINALRAMPRGGELRLTARPVRRDVLIEVADSGSGIAPDEVERVFDRFRKGSTSSGSGLGLTISRDLVEAHGGSISLDSSLGVGTVVRVLLPRVVAG